MTWIREHFPFFDRRERNVPVDIERRQREALSANLNATAQLERELDELDATITQTADQTRIRLKELDALAKTRGDGDD